MYDVTLVFDDDCGFCTYWAEFFAERSSIQLVGFSELPTDLEAKLPDNYRRCSHLVINDTVYSCGESMEQTFVRSSVGRWARPIVSVLRRVSVYNRIREWSYRRIANHRGFWGQVCSTTPARQRKTHE